MLKNQTLEAPPNVLHDQGIPNTLGRIGPVAPVGQLRQPVGLLIAATVAIAAVIAILVVRLA